MTVTANTKVMGENATLATPTRWVDRIGYELYQSTESGSGMVRIFDMAGTLQITKYPTFARAKAAFEREVS